MPDGSRFSLKEFFLKTKPGRMTLLGLLLTGTFFALPLSCAKKSEDSAGAGAQKGTDVEAGAQDLMPDAPRGFDETITLGGKYQSLISRWGSMLAQAQRELAATRKDLGALRNQVEDERSKHAAEKEELVSVLERVKDGVRRDLGGARPPAPLPEDPGLEAMVDGLRAITFSRGGAQEEGPEKTVRIPTASGGLATVLNGVFAPTSGEPSPIRLRLDAALVGPNRSRVGVRNAYLIGKAQGDPNSSRVLVQIDRLSYVASDGKAIEMPALGYVVGGDELEGLPGTYEWRALDLVPLAVTSGAVTGGTEALALREVSRAVTPLGGSLESVTGDPLRYAGLRAAGSGSSKLTEIITERMREIRPAVSAPAGSQVTVVFLEGLTLEGLTHAEIENESGSDPYRGLDSHR